VCRQAAGDSLLLAFRVYGVSRIVLNGSDVEEETECFSLRISSTAANAGTGTRVSMRVPYGDCKHCFWGLAIDRKAALPVSAIAVMMAREMEALLSA
jgi:hypothetical protein